MRQGSCNPGGSVSLAQAVKREKRFSSKQEELVGKLRFEFQRAVNVFQRLFALAKCNVSHARKLGSGSSE